MSYQVGLPHNDKYECNIYGVNFGYNSIPIWWKSQPLGLVDPDTPTEKIQEWIDENNHVWPFIVIKIPGGSHWSGRGETAYSGAEFYVMRVEAVRDSDKSGRIFTCQSIIEIPLRIKGR